MAVSLSSPAFSRHGWRLSWGASLPPEAPATARHSAVLTMWLLSLALAVFLVAFAITSSSRPITEDHAWRQTQTAISVYYMLHGGNWFNYETPVLGWPWTIPFEAPVYHASVALVSSILPLELSGRLVSALYLLGAIGFGCLFLRDALPRGSATPAVFALLSLAAPIQLFWGRAFLIESCAICFGAAHLYFGAAYFRKGRLLYLLGMLIAGSLCALAKATTWPAFAVFLGGYVVWEALKARQVDLARIGGLFVAECAALLAAIAWTAHTDVLKSASLLGELLTSSALHAFNFGTVSQRLSRQLWSSVLMGRILPDIFGGLWLLALAPAACLLLRRFRSRLALCVLAGIGFIVPLLLFTNLHIVHNYYQMANAGFALMAVAVALGALFDRSYTAPAAVLTLALIGSQLLRFSQDDWVTAFAKNENDQIVEASLWVRDEAPAGSAMLAFGLDYSPIAHYYAQRRGIAFPQWAPTPVLLAAASDLDKTLGGLRVGSLIDCRKMGKSNRAYSAQFNERIDELVRDFRQRPGVTEKTFGGCTSLVAAGAAG